MVYYRFRARAAVEVAYTKYSAEDEIVLNETNARKWISKSDFQNGLLVFAGEMGGEEPMFSGSNQRSYNDSKAKQDGSITSTAFDLISMPVVIDLSNPDLTGLYDTDKWWCLAPCDCVFEGFELETLTPANLGAYNYDFDVKVTNNQAWRTGTASGSLLEQAGFRNQPAQNVLTGTSSGWTDGTTAANSPTSAASGTVDLGLAANEAEYLYVGFWDHFVGLYFDIDTVNSEAATCSVQYPQVTASGTISWTDLSITDGTVSGNVSLAQDGAITWERPSDWGKQVIASGYGSWYYVRLVDNDPTTGFTAAADAAPIWVIEDKVSSYDNIAFINAGDKITINQNTTGTATGIYPGTLYLRRVN